MVRFLALVAFAFNIYAEQAKPNVIYINADDYGILDSGFMGRQEYRTPNLDALALEGMVFTNAYSPAANCAPSRACCLSGQSGPRHGVYTVGSSDRGDARTRKLIPIKNTLHLEPDNVTLPAALQAGGYVTGNFGKWHVGEDPLDQGCDVNFGGSEAGGTNKYFSPYGSRMKSLTDGPKGEHLPKRLTDEAMNFISENKETPFFVYLAYYQVHTPIQPRMDLVPKYEGVANINAKYAAMIEGMDIYIGELIAFLKENELYENTLIILSSDNGGINKVSDQEPYRAGKGSYYEGGIRVPMLAVWPNRIKAGSRCEVPVIGTDFYPTIMSATGTPKPEGKILDGVDLMPLFTQTGEIAKRALYWHFPIYLQAYAVGGDEGRDPYFRTRPGSVIQVGKWKLHEYFEDGKFELYNLDDDKGERTNLSDTMPEKVDELKKRLYGWRAQMNAPVPTKLNPKFDPDYKPTAKSKKGKKN